MNELLAAISTGRIILIAILVVATAIVLYRIIRS